MRSSWLGHLRLRDFRERLGGGEAVGEFAHERGFGDGLAVDGGDALHFGNGGFEADHFHFDAELIAGDDGPAEFGVFNGSEKHELAARVRGQFRDQYARDLGHGFNDENTRHDGETREVTEEMRLIDGDVFDADDGIFRHVDDAVDHQHGVAMREDFRDLLDFYGCHGKGHYNSGGGQRLSCQIG